MLGEKIDLLDFGWLKDEFVFEQNNENYNESNIFDEDVFNENIFNENFESFNEFENNSFKENNSFFEKNVKGDIYEFFGNGEKEIFNNESSEKEERFSERELTSLKEVEKIGESISNIPINISLNIDAKKDSIFDTEKVLRAVTERLREELAAAAEGLHL